RNVTGVQTCALPILELTWTVIPLVISLGTFVWSADIFVASRRVPPGAMEVNVVGKRWMWKTQHMTGQREINELHVPVGVPVKLRSEERRVGKEGSDV